MEHRTILGISGSLRQGSFNTSLLKAAEELSPPLTGMAVELYDGLRALPPFDADLDPALQPAVTSFLDRVDTAGALLITTPEYNYGIPGVLKNALDWASIAIPPSHVSALARKPVAIMGASPSPFGTVRAQLALRQLFLWTDSRVVTKPEVHVFDAYRRFDSSGRLTDETTRGFVAQLLKSLAAVVTADAAPRPEEVTP